MLGDLPPVPGQKKLNPAQTKKKYDSSQANLIKEIKELSQQLKFVPENPNESMVLEEEFDPNYKPTQAGISTQSQVFNFYRNTRIRPISRDAPCERPEVFLLSRRGPRGPAARTMETLPEQDRGNILQELRY